MSPRTKEFSEIHQRRLEFRQFVQGGGKSVGEALAFAGKTGFPMPGHYIAHAIFIGKWKVGTFSPTENDREERKNKAKREKVHARIGTEITKHYSESEIEVIEPWSPPS
jgi:hypothetical protein